MTRRILSRWPFSLLAASGKGRTLQRPRRSFRPLLETLESRLTPTVFPTVGAYDVTTLIADINAANLAGGTNTINLTASTYDLTMVNNYWYGPNGLPPITSNLTIHGKGAVIQRNPGIGTPDFRLFYVSGGLEQSAGSLTMDNVTLQGGLAKGGDSYQGGGGLGAGGAIFNQGTLKLTAVTLTDNEALGGSGGVAGLGPGGGGMGGDAADPSGGGGGFGGRIDPIGSGIQYGGSGGTAATMVGGGGGGFVTGANGSNPTGGGQGGFGGVLSAGDTGDGGDGGVGGNFLGGNGGKFGAGGGFGAGPGGGGGVGGGGGAAGTAGAIDYGGLGGSGGFGGGGAAASATFGGGSGGFGGGGGSGGVGGIEGFGGGFGGTSGIGGGGAGLGGAIFNMGADSSDTGSGQAVLVNCTLTANSAVGGTGAQEGNGLGGAIFNLDGSTALASDTLDNNTVAGGPANGGAVYNLAFGNDITGPPATPVTATLTVVNSILADSTGGPDLGGQAIPGAGTNTATINGSFNLVQDPASNISLQNGNMTGIDPQLGLLTINNGGLTPTMLPSAASPVLGAGVTGFFTPTTDQRGQPRPASGPIDLGSVQRSVPVSPPPASPPAESSPPTAPAPPSLIQAILGLYIAEVEFDINKDTNSQTFGSSSALMSEMNFYSQYTVLLGINIASLITQDADEAVSAAGRP